MPPGLRNLLPPLGLLLVLVLAWQGMGWKGLVAAGGGIVMWLLLHWTRMMAVMRRAAQRPIGHVDSAVMLNARLQKGVALLHVVAMTRSLGECLEENVAGAAHTQTWRWRDPDGSSVSCTFAHGRLRAWRLHRPQQQEGQEGPQGDDQPASATA